MEDAPRKMLCQVWVAKCTSVLDILLIFELKSSYPANAYHSYKLDFININAEKNIFISLKKMG